MSHAIFSVPLFFHDCTWWPQDFSFCNVKKELNYPHLLASCDPMDVHSQKTLVWVLQSSPWKTTLLANNIVFFVIFLRCLTFVTTLKMRWRNRIRGMELLVLMQTAEKQWEYDWIHVSLLLKPMLFLLSYIIVSTKLRRKAGRWWRKLSRDKNIGSYSWQDLTALINRQQCRQIFINRRYLSKVISLCIHFLVSFCCCKKSPPILWLKTIKNLSSYSYGGWTSKMGFMSQIKVYRRICFLAFSSFLQLLEILGSRNLPFSNSYSVATFPSLTLTLLTLYDTGIHCDYNGYIWIILTSKSLITSAESFFSWVLGFKMWASLGEGIVLPTAPSFMIYLFFSSNYIL